METMKIVQALCTLIFLLIPLALSTSNASILQDTCKSIAACPWDRGYYHCLKFFQAENRSAIVDKHSIAIVATKIIEVAVKSTAKSIDTLMASEKDKMRLGCLRACSKVYMNAMNQTGEAIKGIVSGKAGGLQDAVTALSVVHDSPSACEGEFDEVDEPSPLEVEDADFKRQAGIALCVVSALLLAS